jgi:hypothetical protein
MIINLIIVIAVIIIFVIFISYQLESFTDKNYTNTNVISPDYYSYNSYLPYDIISKNKDDVIYDYGNDELNEIFRKKFNIDYKKVITLSDGINWSKWNDVNEINHSTRLYNYYLNVIDDFSKGLNDSCFDINGSKYKIIKHHLKRYKYSLDDSNTNLLDISVLIYRDKRPLAKHIKILAICNGIYTNFLMIKVIGVVPECQLKTSISTYDITNDEDKYSHFTPTEYVNYDMNSFIYDTNDKLANSEAEATVYYNLLKDLR